MTEKPCLRVVIFLALGYQLFSYLAYAFEDLPADVSENVTLRLQSKRTGILILMFSCFHVLHGLR